MAQCVMLQNCHSKRKVVYKDLTCDEVITEYLTEKEFNHLYEIGEMYDVVQWVELPDWGEKTAS